MKRAAVVCVAMLVALAVGIPGAARAVASWRLEQPTPPPPPPGVQPAPGVVPLGTIGDIEFWEPPGSPPQANRGLLITHGNGDAVGPGVWAYDGAGWHEIATVCGATNGRIAWGGPADFWTVSDGRTGQAEINGKRPPLEDNSLCHFAGGSVVGSYAHLAFEANSYEAMSGGACLPPQPPQVSSTDCWFGGAALEEPQPPGSFHLHWNGTTVVEQPYLGQGDPVEEMRQIENAIFESVDYRSSNRRNESTSLERPPLLHVAEAEAPFGPLSTSELPLFGSSEEPTEDLEYLRLGSTEGVLWAAAGKQAREGKEGEVTVLRRVDGLWTQLIGPGEEGRPGSGHPLPSLFASSTEESELLGGPAKDAQVRAIAPEPGSGDAWLALARHGESEAEAAATAAVLVHVSAQGEVLGVQVLPDSAERALPSDPAGAVRRIVCPALEDCWMANVNGWLYHLSPEGERTLPTSELPGFPEGKIISERPKDEGFVQEVLDAPPPEDSGLKEETPEYSSFAEKKEPKAENKVTLPLISKVHSHLKGTTLQLSFQLSVKARVRLLARRKGRLVAQTRNRVLGAGGHTLSLRLERRRWPTKLSFQTHALAPLRVVSSVGGEGVNITTETTELRAPLGALLTKLDRLP